MTGFSTRQWNYAFLFAFLMHISLFVVFVNKPASTARDKGLQGIEIALGPAGGIPAPVVEEITEAPIEEETNETETVEEVIDTPEPIPEEPKEKSVEVKKEAEVILKKKEIVKVVKKSLPPVSKIIETPKPIETKVKPMPKKATSSGSMALSGTKNKQDRDDGDATKGGGIKGITTSYVTVLQSWLEKHKKYPRRARKKGQEGIVILYFKMDREGNVLSYRIKQSSGYSQLDDEVEAMIKRAQPLPRIPEDMNKETLELIVPVQFHLR